MSWLKLLLLCLFISMVQVVLSQGITVTTEQGLGFGDFTQTSDLGGTVDVSSTTGARSSTGSVTLMESSAWFYSIFTITTDSAEPTVTTDQPTATLIGSNGGSMSLQMAVADPQSVTVSVLSPAEVHIGGTLTLGSRSDNPPGTYSGDVLVTFTANYQ